ncbi:MAG TPA: glucose-6-phosphate dehydrogenase assembly protein OpcA [Thermoanaerobaculia bacterium]|nr:glucose-6-phosphate dehydrogenase assembly protein OpcA [Thermoanaerobaculia bacterium]
MTSIADARVDPAKIERELAALWRSEHEGAPRLTRAALWNVVAYAQHPHEHQLAEQVMPDVSVTVPQRTIIVAEQEGETLDSWISANCHLVGAERQICSEEITISAGKSRRGHIAPLVASLLLPNMPVAVWWLGDLPDENEKHADEMLDDADRLIVDSSQFDSVTDLVRLRKITKSTRTAAADLNWVRLEEWRTATAALFDPPAMRERLQNIRAVRITAGGDGSFGAQAESLLYCGWLMAQLKSELEIDIARGDEERHMQSIEIRFEDGSTAAVNRDSGRNVVVGTGDANAEPLDCVVRLQTRELAGLIARQLRKPENDRVYEKALHAATELAGRRG